jgi:hypothetical protein
MVPQGWCVNGPAALFKVMAQLRQLLSDLSCAMNQNHVSAHFARRR